MMKLNVIERILLLNIPAPKWNSIDLTRLDEVKKKIALSKEEIEKYEIKITTGQIETNKLGAEEIEILLFSDVMFLKNFFFYLDKKNELPPECLSLQRRVMAEQPSKFVGTEDGKPIEDKKKVN